RHFESTTRHTFGHPHAVDWAILLMLCLLAATHLFIGFVMWIQRSYWVPSEAAMFRFIAVKALLWIDFVLAFKFTGRGVLLDIAYIYVLIAGTTIDMDWRM